MSGTRRRSPRRIRFKNYNEVQRFKNYNVDNILDAETALKDKIIQAPGRIFGQRMESKKDLGRIINDTLKEEYDKKVNNAFLELANDTIQNSKIVMLSTAAAIRELQDDYEESQFTRRSTVTEEEDKKRKEKGAIITSKIKALKSFLVYNNIKYNSEIMNIVEHGHQYTVFDNMDMKEVMENHNTINEVVECGEGLLTKCKDKETDEQAEPAAPPPQQHRPSWKQLDNGSWALEGKGTSSCRQREDGTWTFDKRSTQNPEEAQTENEHSTKECDQCENQVKATTSLCEDCQVELLLPHGPHPSDADSEVSDQSDEAPTEPRSDE